ncbi:MAG: hypothetical protein NC212_01785 [Staphylococcus sp.]|nr:hypothetical protein [Staphylococcus sp.]
MKSFGKGLFWIGFIILMGVVIAYMITMFVGTMAFASWVTALTFSGFIILGGLFMLIGRSSERKGELKEQKKEFDKTLNEIDSTYNKATDTTTTSGTQA